MKKIFMLALVGCSLFLQNAIGLAKTDTLSIDLKGVDVNAERIRLYSTQSRSLTVIDRKTIQQMPVQNIDELLESVSGVDIRNRGVGGTQSDISIRGGSFDQVLVLLNGINITDPQTGHYNLDVPVELSDIVRIELLQGSAARIYGSNAFSGAINIVTEKIEKASVFAQLAAGSFGTFNQNISAGIGNGKIQTFASFTHKKSEGYINNTDYDMLNVFSQSVLNTKTAGKFDLQMAYQQKSYGANAFYSFKYPSQFDHTKTLFAALSWVYSKEKLSLTAQSYVRRHYDRFELFRDSIKVKPIWYAGHNYHLTDVLGAKATASFMTVYGKATVGVDVRNEHIFSNALGILQTQPVLNPFDKLHSFTKEDNRLLSSAFVDYAKNFNSFQLSLGASTTYSAQFGLQSSGGLDLAYLLNENSRLYLSANTAVRLPTFTDLYLQNSTQKADPNLKPEQSKTIELGAKYNKNNLKLDGSLFYRMGTNVIDWVKMPDSTKFESKNLADVNAFGTDIMADYVFEKGIVKRITASYSYLTLDKKAVSFDSKYALDYLRHKAVIGLQHAIWNNLSANWKLSYNDRAGDYTDFTTSQKLNYTPYVMADMRLAWTTAKYEIYADVNNLLNQTYADYGGLTQPGTNFMAGVRIKID